MLICLHLFALVCKYFLLPFESALDVLEVFVDYLALLFPHLGICLFWLSLCHFGQFYFKGLVMTSVRLGELDLFWLC